MLRRSSPFCWRHANVLLFFAFGKKDYIVRAPSFEVWVELRMLLSGTKHSLGTVPYTEASALLATARQNLRDACEILWTGAEKGSRDFIGCPHAGRIANAFLGFSGMGYEWLSYHALSHVGGERQDFLSLAISFKTRGNSDKVSSNTGRSNFA